MTCKLLFHILRISNDFSLNIDNIVDISLTAHLQSLLSQDSFQFPGNLGGLLDHAVERNPIRDGIAVPGQVLTFGQYYDSVCRMVHGLKKIGLARNDRVLFISQNSLNYTFISLAVLRIGAILVPLNPRIQHYELAHVLSETHPKYIICERSSIVTALTAYELIHESQLPHFITIDEKAPSTIFISELDLTTAAPYYETMNPDDTAMVVYTAAMNGYPLGAKLTHASLFYDTAFVAREIFKKDESEHEVVSSILPLFHSYGFTVGFLAPLAGSVTCVVLNTSLGARKIVDILEAYQATQIFSVPAIYFSIMKPLSANPHLRSRLRNLTSGGIAMPIELLERYKNQLGLSISEGYGLTEASPVVTWNGIDRPPKFGTVGYPLACCQVKVVDDSGKMLLPGHDGEVLVKGLNMFSGYLNQVEYTQNAFVDGWFKTGDLGHLDEENYLTITGIKKDMINIFGLKVYPKEVERIMLYHPDIKSARIWCEWDEKYGNIVACEVSFHPGCSLGIGDLQNWCRLNLSPYKIPRRIRISH